MNANPILQKLDGLTARFEEVSTLITDPEVIADRNRFVRLTKEYKGLEELLAAKRDYEQLLANLDEARSIVMNDDDPDLKEMAREEIATGEERLPALEEQIKLLPIRRTLRTPSSRFAAARAATRPHSLPATSIGCTPNTAR